MAANTNLESERNRGNERRIAVWGVFAALAAALIGSAAAIGGGILGANIQASSNKTEGDREFTQTQELTLYSKFMQSAQSVYDDAFYFVQSAEAAQYGKTSNSTTTMKNRRTTLATAQQEMNLIIYQLHIVGSDVAYKAAVKYQDDVEAAIEAQQTARGTAQFRAILQRLFNEDGADMSAFVAIAKKDISD
jgi:hypothetical protein